MNVKLTRTTAVGERPALTRKDRFTANAPRDSLVMVLLALVSGCLMCTQKASQVFIAHVASTFGLGQRGVDFRPTLKRPATREKKAVTQGNDNWDKLDCSASPIRTRIWIWQKCSWLIDVQWESSGSLCPIYLTILWVSNLSKLIFCTVMSCSFLKTFFS